MKKKFSRFMTTKTVNITLIQIALVLGPEITIFPANHAVIAEVMARFQDGLIKIKTRPPSGGFLLE